MPSWFDAEAESLDGILEEYGTPFLLQPFRRAVNYPTEPDPTREPRPFIGAFERDAKLVALGMEEAGVSTRHLCITARLADVRDAKQGDRVTDQLTGETFEITDPRPDGLSGIELRIVQLGRAKR